MKRIALSLAGLIVSGRWIGAQNTEFKPMQITTFRILCSYIDYDFPKEYQYYPKDYLNKYPDSVLRFFPQGLIEYVDTTKNISLVLDTQVITPVKVKYSLYTYKKTFSQDGKRNYWQGVVESGLVKPLTTQADIDNALDKIYEFPAVTETVSGQRELSWNGYTDPKFTGQKYAVRDCLYIAAHNADTGELIDTHSSITPVQMYTSGSLPSVVYRIDEHKDANGKVVKETLSGKVLLAYPDDWPIKKITAMILIEGCGFGALSFDVINQGADAIAADINRRIPGDVVAHIALTNPTVDNDNKDIKIFDWKDIKTEDGKDFIPDLIKYPGGYSLSIIVEMDEMTYTGIKNGSMGSGQSFIPLVVPSYTDIETIEKSDISITSGKNGIIVYCPAGVSAMQYTVYDLSGRALKAGNLSGTSRETITVTELHNGIYFVRLTVNENSKEKTVTKKVVIQ